MEVTAVELLLLLVPVRQPRTRLQTLRPPVALRKFSLIIQVYNQTDRLFSDGISQADIEAADNGGLTAAETPSISDTLGLDIE